MERLKETGALLRMDDGTCERTIVIFDGDNITDGFGNVLTRTDETVTLQGWGELDGEAIAYRAHGTYRLLIPSAVVQ